MRWWSKSVQYRCERCGYAEKYTLFQYLVLNVTWGIFIFLILCGFASLMVIMVVGVNPIMDAIVNQNYAAVNRAEDAQLRALAVNWTRPCDGNDAECYAQNIYQHLSGTRYIPDSFNGNHSYSPLEYIRWGGDCKAGANAYVALLNSVGIRARVETNLAWRHAVAVVPNDAGARRLGGFFVIDLTDPSATFLHEGQEVWSYRYEPDSPEWAANHEVLTW